MSASMRPTRCPRAASATAMFTATVDFPTPPFPELTAITRPSLGISPGCGAGIWPVDCGWDGGGPCVVRAGPARSPTVIFTPSGWTPSSALTAVPASRTPGDARGSGIMPAEGRSLSSRGFLMRPRAAATRASRGGVTKSNRLHLLHFRHQLPEARLDPLTERDRGSAAPGAGTAQAQQQHTVALVEIHDLDMSPVGGDVGAEGIERLLDAVQGIGHRLSVVGQRLSVVGQRSSVSGRRSSVVGRRSSAIVARPIPDDRDSRTPRQ